MTTTGITRLQENTSENVKPFCEFSLIALFQDE